MGTFPRNTGWMSFLCLIAPRLPGDTTSGQFAMKWVGIPDCARSPQGLRSLLSSSTLPVNTFPWPGQGSPAAKEADWGIQNQIKTAPVFSCTTHIFLSVQLLGGKKVACIVPQNLSYWEQSLGRALGGAPCFGVSSLSQPRGRQELSCVHALCSTHRSPTVSSLEDTWSTFRAMLPRILSWAALCRFIFHTKSDTIQFLRALLWFWWLITLCWAVYWHSRPLRFCRINK